MGPLDFAVQSLDFSNVALKAEIIFGLFEIVLPDKILVKSRKLVFDLHLLLSSRTHSHMFYSFCSG